MRAYEITAVLQETPASIVDETKNTIKEFFKKYSVEMTEEEDWGSKKLWHAIRGLETGHYSHFKCKAEPTAIAKLENEFKLNQNILRSLVIKV